ncbi:MAG: response regulator [Cyanobacteria bacterium J06621_11]
MPLHIKPNKKPDRLPAGRILILENDYSNRILFADYLEQCGYSVCQLADEQKIFESLLACQPDVLMLNLKLPILDGFSVIEQLRSHPKWKKLAILVVSGYSLMSDRQKAYRSGADAYLVKPILPADLSASVAHLIQSAVA